MPPLDYKTLEGLRDIKRGIESLRNEYLIRERDFSEPGANPDLMQARQETDEWLEYIHQKVESLLDEDDRKPRPADSAIALSSEGEMRPSGDHRLS